MRGGVLEMLSEDHVEELYYVDKINKRSKPGLIQYMGMDPEEIRIEPTIKCRNLEPDDRYLICSDGLTDMVSEADIATMLNEGKDSEDAANRLVDLALSNGGKDNITVIVFQCLINKN
jgi:protein phosphatase